VLASLRLKQRTNQVILRDARGGMTKAAMRWVLPTLAGALIVLSAFGLRTAGAEPTQAPAPGPAATSTSDELADMVMDVIQHGGPAAPTTNPVPAPPH
jgi:hypothetical protein